MQADLLDAADFDPLAPGVRHWRLGLGPEWRSGRNGRPAEPSLTISVGSGGRGPTVLVCGGTHGDEFEGQIAALELARALPSLTIDGRLIVVPFHHEAACREGTRLSPLDGRDLNRRYGLEEGIGAGPTAAIASFIEETILPHADIVIDLHSGGEAHEFVLSANLQAAIGSAEESAMLPALLAFDAPYAIVFAEAGETAMPHRGTLEGAARQRGKRAVSSEIGGGGRLTTASLRVARQGLVNLLHHFGVVRSAAAVPWRDSRSRLLTLSRPQEHLTAPCAGWFCPDVALGDTVSQGDSVGALVRDDHPQGAPEPVRALTDGVIAALAARTRQSAGAVVAYVAAVATR